MASNLSREGVQHLLPPVAVNRTERGREREREGERGTERGTEREREEEREQAHGVGEENRIESV
jgi:hypothetical protein